MQINLSFLVKQKHHRKKNHLCRLPIVSQVRLQLFVERRKHQVIVMILVNFFVIDNIRPL
jgi:hypothetical protein